MHYVTSGDNLIIDRKDEQYKSGAQFNLSMNSAKICGQLFFSIDAPKWLWTHQG